MSQCSETDSQVHTLSLASLLVMFSCSVMSDSLWLHGLQLTRLPCLSLSPRVCSDSCPLSRWCHSTISSSVVPFSSHLQSFPESVFSKESVLIRWPKYWSFSLQQMLITLKNWCKKSKMKELMYCIFKMKTKYIIWVK